MNMEYEVYIFLNPFLPMSLHTNAYVIAYIHTEYDSFCWQIQKTVVDKSCNGNWGRGTDACKISALNNIQLLDEAEQNIVIYQWRADQLIDAFGIGK